MAASVYTRAGFLMAKADIDLDTADLRCLLVTSAYAFNADHDYVADVVVGEISVGGYARQAFASELVALDDANDRWTLDAADVAFGALSAGATTTKLIVFAFITSDALSPLIACYDFAVTTNGGTVTAQVNAIGLLRGPT